MTISNCSAYSANSVAQPITGAVVQKDKTTGMVMPAPAVQAAKDAKPVDNVQGEAGLSSGVLGVLLSLQSA